jgi:hypothetical protein
MSDPAKLREALLIAAEQIQKQKVIIEAQNELLHWAFGDGPLPCDEEAERAAWGYLRAVAVDGGLRASIPYLQRTKGLLTTRCPDVFEVPTMPWSEVLRRLRAAAELRVAVGRIKLALRRAMGGDRTGTIRALRGAVDVFGEAKASDYVRLQWRVAELEAELRELRAVKAAQATP